MRPKVILVGSVGMRDVARKIKGYTKDSPIDLTGMTDMRQIVSVLQLSDCVISNDSGPSHIAAAVKTPVVSIFVRNDPGVNVERWKPLGDNAYALSPLRSDGLDGEEKAVSVEDVLKIVVGYLKSDRLS